MKWGKRWQDIRQVPFGNGDYQCCGIDPDDFSEAEFPGVL